MSHHHHKDHCCPRECERCIKVCILPADPPRFGREFGERENFRPRFRERERFRPEFREREREEEREEREFFPFF